MDPCSAIGGLIPTWRPGDLWDPTIYRNGNIPGFSFLLDRTHHNVRQLHEPLHHSSTMAAEEKSMPFINKLASSGMSSRLH